MAELMPLVVVDRQLRAARDAQNAAETLFRRSAAEGGLKAIEWRAPAGDPMSAAVAHGRSCDLVVLGQRDPDDARGSFTAELLTTCLFALGRPVLAIPSIGAGATIARRILIATDGGREAARAIGDAMPLLERAEQVRVMIGADVDPDREPTYAQTSARIDAWLRDHGIEATLERYDREPADKGEWLLSRAADHGSDLIVMGGYGHARVREFVLGGMTQTILRSMTVPVLMSH
jgi:nucleotide-binding universal stress UspA family protein